MNENEQISTQTLLEQWFGAQSDLAAIKDKEALLRKELDRRMFSDAKKEGVSYRDLAGDGGYRLKRDGKINRNVSQSKLLECKSALGRYFDIMFKPKYELVLKEYRRLFELSTLTKEEQDVLNMLADIVTATEGMPSLEIVGPPKRK